MKTTQGHYKPSRRAALLKRLDSKDRNLSDGKAPKNLMLSLRKTFQSRFKYNKPLMVPEIYYQ